MLRFLLFCTMLAGAAAAQHGARNATARPTQGQLATNATARPTTTAKPTTTEQGWPHDEPKIITDGKDMTLIPPSTGSIKFAEPSADNFEVTVADFVATDKGLQDQVSTNLKAQEADAAATGDKIKKLQTAIDTDLAAAISKLDGKLAAVGKQSTDGINALKADTARKLAAADKKADGRNTATNAMLGKMQSAFKSDIAAVTKAYTKKVDDALYCAKAPSGYVVSKEVEKDYKAGKIYTGIFVTAPVGKCGKGKYTWPQNLYCTNSKRWCGNPQYCAATTKPSCKACFSGCEQCSNANTCQKCAGMRVVQNGKCVEPSSCWQLWRDKKITAKSGVAKLTYLSPKNNKKVNGWCVTEGGRAHTMIPCNYFTGGCRGFHRFNERNTCEDFGYQITPMRNRAHFNLAWDKIGGGFLNSMAPSMHIYKTGGGGRYTNCAMKHGSGHCGQWRAKDGKHWWLRDGGYSEPNGDYSGWCHLTTRGVSRSAGFTFNDGGCYHSGSRYWCGTQDYDGKGSPNGN